MAVFRPRWRDQRRVKRLYVAMERRLLTPTPCATSAKRSRDAGVFVSDSLHREERVVHGGTASPSTSRLGQNIGPGGSRSGHRRGMPNGANAEGREMPNGARCRTAPNAERRMMPYGAKTAPTLLRLRG